ncbi:TM2 domain-containing protein [Paenibacillus pinihumi]|uniref:TM2 domain-containing protein n=1 Tax=Paenibacillus pinihumi TaxID=669462 RepID=UPI0004297DF9|nr:TM2 domain-containing protein [Paenibacillus pinihumi]
MNHNVPALTPYYPYQQPVPQRPDLNALEEPPGHLIKNRVLAYIIWYFLGLFGGHRFYTGRRKSGWAQLALSLTIAGLPLTLVWWAVDAFYLHKWVHSYNNDMQQQFKSRLFYYEHPSVFVH